MTKSQPMPVAPATKEGVALLGKPVLGTADAVAQSLAMGPLLSIGLVGSLVAGAGPAAPFTLLLAFLGSLSLGWVFAQYGRRYAGAGAVYEYVTRVHGKRLGLFIGIFFFLPTPLVGGALLSAMGELIQDFSVQYLGFNPGWLVSAAGTGVIAAALAYFGVRLAVRTQLILTALSTVPFLVFTVAVIAKGGASGNTLRVFTPGAAGQGHILEALIYALLMFAGFESAACLGEETRLPHASIPRAILLTISLAGVFYVTVMYAATIGFGPTNVERAWGGDPAALWALADQYAGRPTGALMHAGVVIDAVVVMIAFLNLTSRGFFSLARDGLLPRAAARISRHDTPVGGLLVVIVPALLALLVALPLERKFVMFEVVFKAGGIIMPFGFIVLVAGTVHFLRGQPRRFWLWPVPVVAAGVPAMALYGALVPFPKGTELVGVGLGITLYIVAAAWTIFLFVRYPDRVENAVRHVLEPKTSG